MNDDLLAASLTVPQGSCIIFSNLLAQGRVRILRAKGGSGVIDKDLPVTRRKERLGKVQRRSPPIPPSGKRFWHSLSISNCLQKSCVELGGSELAGNYYKIMRLIHSMSSPV